MCGVHALRRLDPRHRQVPGTRNPARSKRVGQRPFEPPAVLDMGARTPSSRCWDRRLLWRTAQIGVDEVDSYEDLRKFVQTVAAAAGPGAHFVVHARKAILSGLSTHQNRSVPPLHYDVVCVPRPCCIVKLPMRLMSGGCRKLLLVDILSE